MVPIASRKYNFKQLSGETCVRDITNRDLFGNSYFGGSESATKMRAGLTAVTFPTEAKVALYKVLYNKELSSDDEDRLSTFSSYLHELTKNLRKEGSFPRLSLLQRESLLKNVMENIVRNLRGEELIALEVTELDKTVFEEENLQYEQRWSQKSKSKKEKKEGKKRKVEEEEDQEKEKKEGQKKAKKRKKLFNSEEEDEDPKKGEDVEEKGDSKEEPKKPKKKINSNYQKDERKSKKKK